MREKALLHGYVLCNSKMLQTLQGWSGTKNIFVGDKLSMAMHSQDTSPAPGDCICGGGHFIATNGHTWSWVVVSGHVWLYTVGHSDTGLSVVICGHLWLRAVMDGGEWSCMVIHGSAWSSMVASGHVWPYTVGQGNI